MDKCVGEKEKLEAGGPYRSYFISYEEMLMMVVKALSSQSTWSGLGRYLGGKKQDSETYIERREMKNIE